jgi:micrococcal nuclease
MKQSIFFLTIIFLFCAFVQSNTLIGRVVGISDGDTITLLVDEKTQFKIRLADIDCPEKKQAFGQAAKKYLSDLIYGKTVSVQWKKKDRNNRIIGEIILGNQNINHQMVKAGYAWQYLKYSNDATLAQLEMNARKQKLGLWIDPNPIAPWLFRAAKREHKTQE